MTDDDNERQSIGSKASDGTDTADPCDPRRSIGDRTFRLVVILDDNLCFNYLLVFSQYNYVAL